MSLLPHRRGRVASLLAVLPLALAASPVNAQLDDEPSLRLFVTHLDGVLGGGSPGGSADAGLRVAVDNIGTVDVADVRIVIEVHAAARSRGLLRAALDRDTIQAPAVFVTDIELRDGQALAPGDIASAAVVIDGAAAGWTGGSGVHPVAVSLVRGTEVLDRVVTAVVHLAQHPVTTLDTLVVWPMTDRPWRLAPGEYPAGVDQPIRTGGRLDRLLVALEQVPNAPIAIAPGAHLLEDLVDRADGYDVSGANSPRAPESPGALRANAHAQRLRTTSAERPVAPLATAYANVDLALLAPASTSVADIASDAAASGRDRVDELLGRDPDPGVMLVHDRIGTAGMELLSSPTVVVGWDVVDGPDLSLDATLDSPVRRITTPSGRRVTLLVADPYIQRQLEAPNMEAGALVAAHRVIVESAMIHFQAPGRDERPLVILPPKDADLPGDVGTRLLQQLVAAPWLTLTDPDSVREGATIDPATLLEVAPTTRLPGDLEDAMAAAADLVDGLDRTLVREGPGVVDPARLRDDLARAASTWFRGDPSARRQGVARVRAAANALLGRIEVAAAAGVTLTAEAGTIPITLRRPEGAPLDVRVTLDAQGRLGWPDGDQSATIRLAPDTPQTVSFTTVARSRGTFPVIVRVTDPSGTRVLHQATVSVRSTVISGPALTVLGAIVVLLIMVGLVRRRPRTARLRAVQDLPEPTSSDEH